MSSYCANYYGSVNCHNTVARFGDRCKLCLALNSGASLSEGLLPQDYSHGKNGIAEAPRRHHYRSQDGSSRAMRIDSRYYKK